MLQDLDSAQAEAVRALGDMARDAARTLKGSDAQRLGIDVRDDAGLVMHVRFAFEIKRRN
jgi:hypothetical protein